MDGNSETSENGSAALVVAVADQFDAQVVRGLGGRSSLNWLVRRGEQLLVLREDQDLFELGRQRLGEAISWRATARASVGASGWPVPLSVERPLWTHGSWWTLETFVPGQPAELTPERHAALLARWQELRLDLDELGPQPHRLDHLAVLSDDDAWRLFADVEDTEDRRWLRQRLEQVLPLAERVDWGASPRRLVHGDLVSQNLLWQGPTLAGVLDFELATVDRRVTELIHTWRCRYDDVVLAYDAHAPLNDHEWRMLLVDWWALLLSLSLFHLKRGREPGRWELEALRRSSGLALRLAANA